LGRGGMGIVYLVRQTALKRLAAVKVLRRGADAQERRRFRTEAEAAARLTHPHIAHIYEVGEHADQPYLILEYVEGGNLARRVAGNSWTFREATELVRLLAEAVQYAHSQGVLHRDLTPANVLLDGAGRPKITDFGLAKIMHSVSGEPTRTEAVLGTPSYMSPEQAAGRSKQVGPAADVYALGAILYELLTGRPPFKGESPLDTLRQVLTDEPLSPRRLRPAVPRDLETICLKCLQNKAADRYATAAGLAEDLRRFLAGEPIQARPPSALRRLNHWGQRHPAAAVTLAASLLLAATVTLGSLWYSAQLSHALAGEQEQRRVAERNEAYAGQLVYGSDMKLASQLLRAGDIYSLSDLLDRHLPTTGAKDHREFAWYYTRPFSQPSPPDALQATRIGYVSLISFSTDGRLLMTAGSGDHGLVQVWEMPLRRSQMTAHCLATAHSHEQLAVLYPDGKTLAVVPESEWSAVRLLDVATGNPKGSLQHPADVNRLVLSADGKTLFTVAGGNFHRWDAISLRKCEPGVNVESNNVLLTPSPDGRTLASVTADRQGLELSDLSRGALIQRVRFSGPIETLTYSPTGKFLAVGQKNDKIHFFHTDRGQLIGWPMGPEVSRENMPVAFSPDDHWVAIGLDEEVQLWDVRNRTFHRRLRWQASWISTLSFSPDGQLLSVGTQEGLLHFVNPYRPPAHDTLRADLRPSGAPAITHNGKTLAIPDEDGTVKIVDAGSGKVRLTLPVQDVHFLVSAFSPDNCTLATTSPNDTRVRLWDTTTGREKESLRAGPLELTCYAYSPTGNLLAAGEAGDNVWVWDLTTGQLRGKLPGHGSDVNCLAISADGRVLVSSDSLNNVNLWDLPPQGPLPRVPREQLKLPGNHYSVAFAPTGRTLAVGQSNGEVALLEVPEVGAARRLGAPLMIGSIVRFVAFGPDGRFLLVGRDDPSPQGRFIVWDVRSHSLHASLWVYDINGAAWMPDGRLLVRSLARQVRILDLKTGAARLLPDQAPWPVLSLAFSPDSQSLYLGTGDPLGAIQTRPNAWLKEDHRCKGDVADAVRVWDVVHLAPGPRLPGEQAWSLPEQIALSAEGRFLAAGGDDGSIRVWDLQGRRIEGRLFISKQAEAYASMMEKFMTLWGGGKPEFGEHSEKVLSLAFSPDRHWLAAAGARGTVTLWDTDSWQEHHPFAEAQQSVAWLGFSPSSDLAIACKGQIRLCDPRTGLVRATLGSESDAPILCGAFNPDGHLLAAGTATHRIRVWDLASATEQRVLSGHMNQVAGVAFSPDGKTLASGDWSGEVKMWSTATLQEVASLEGPRARIRCLAISPDGRTLAAGAGIVPGLGEVLLWRAPGLAPAQRQ
jgi:eukaryotic-like serine/threonine-protein kinase